MDVCWRNLCRLKASDFISMTSIFSQQKKRKVQTQLRAFICNLDEHTIRCIRGDESPLLRPPSWRVRKRFCMFVVSLIHSDFIHSSVVSQSVCLEDNNIREVRNSVFPQLSSSSSSSSLCFICSHLFPLRGGVQQVLNMLNRRRLHLASAWRTVNVKSPESFLCQEHETFCVAFTRLKV